jgi:hypothetical protein
MMRTAISPRFAIRIFVNMRRRTLAVWRPNISDVTTLQEAHPPQARRAIIDAIRAGLRDSSRVRYTLYMYLASRVLYLVIAAVSMAVVHIAAAHTGLSTAHNWEGAPLGQSTLGSEMSNWDGKWYLLTTQTWYFHHVVPHAGSYTTLGFMPLYPMLMWVLAHAIGYFGAGILISMVSGGIATLLVGQLAEQWWGPERARRAIAFWCFFPGTIVFSMVYSEGVTVALIAGAMILMHRRQWLWAGVCAGFATAIAPAALSAVPMCAVAALLELHRRGSSDADTNSLLLRAWRRGASGREARRELLAPYARGLRDRSARRSLLAPILAPAGAIGFGIYLWFWTGSPLADYRAQHIEWSESTTPLAVPHVAIQFVRQLFVAGVGSHGPGGVDLNDALALLGTGFLLWAYTRLWKFRLNVPLTAWVWTLCVSVLALSSAKTPPNPRLLVLAFPLVLAAGATLTRGNFRRAMWWVVFATVVMSPITYIGEWLRP